MVVTAFLFVEWFAAMNERDQAWDFDTDSIKNLLTTVTYVPNQDTHKDHADITNEVAAGGGYTTGGEVLGSKTNLPTLNVYALDAADTQWTAATFTARRDVIYDDTPAVSGDKPLCRWEDFGQDEVVSSGTFTIQHNAAGFVTLTATNAPGFP